MDECYACGFGRTESHAGCPLPVGVWPEGQKCAMGHTFSMANVLAFCTFRVLSDDTGVFEYNGEPLVMAPFPTLEPCAIKYLNETPILPGSDLSWADFSDFDLDAAFDLSLAMLAGANFSEKEIGYGIMRKACLVGANFSYAQAGFLLLEGADLAMADLSGLMIYESANFRGANLVGANICGANLAVADLTDAVLEDVQLDGETLLPPGHEIVDSRIYSSVWILD